MNNTMTTIDNLIKAVEDILGDFSKDRNGYGAASKMLDWPTRAALQLALIEAKAQKEQVD